MNIKLLFSGICFGCFAFYALLVAIAKWAGAPLEPVPEMFAAIPVAPCQTACHDAPASVEAIMGACLMMASFALVVLYLAYRLGRASFRALMYSENRAVFTTLLLMTPVLLKVAATKDSGSGDMSSSKKLPSNPVNPVILAKNPSLLSQNETHATQRAYALDAETHASFTTNFFAGRLYTDPQIVGVPKTLSFAPTSDAPGGGALGEHALPSPDNPLGTLLALYNLPSDLQAVVALATLDNGGNALAPTLLHSPNLLVQLAPDDWADPQTSPRFRRFLPMDAERRMFVNGAETSLLPRNAWCVIAIESDPANPIDMTLGTLGGDGSHSLGGAYWPGRVAEVVFVPRAWKPDPESPAEPVAWDDTLRNALESYLLYKHRHAMPGYFRNVPPSHAITREKIALVANTLGLPHIKLPGTLLLVK